MIEFLAFLGWWVCTHMTARVEFDDGIALVHIDSTSFQWAEPVAEPVQWKVQVQVHDRPVQAAVAIANKEAAR